MKAEEKNILTGTHEFTGNEACVEGALAAGCKFLGLYPIVPALEISERFSRRCLETGATFIQMEDEISALACVIGAAWTGKRSLAVTSGPGLSLMQEHIGLAVMLETPCVIVDVQRVGPGIGLPDRAAQGDMMQARWGSHGDYELIALAPASSQEMFECMIKAFNLSERFRIPVIVMTDAYLAQLREKVVIPTASKIHIEPRRYYQGPKEKYLPFKRDKDYIPRMVDIGHGYKFHITGLTHDDRGYPVMNEECQEYNVHPLVWKIRQKVDEIVQVEELNTKDAEVVVVSYGTPSRAAVQAVKEARKEGINAGSLKLLTVWPFPERRVTELAKKARALIVPEMNFGQLVYEVERCAAGRAETVFIHHGDHGFDNYSDILKAIKKAVKGK